LVSRVDEEEDEEKEEEKNRSEWSENDAMLMIETNRYII